MKYYGLLLTILLTGCSTTVPVVAKFPEAPPSLKVACPELKKIEGDAVSIVDLHKTVVENYGLYYQCSLRNDGWISWYGGQKKIFEEANK
jgi:hypothetical protein